MYYSLREGKMIKNHWHEITHKWPVWRLTGAFMVCYIFVKVVDYFFDKARIVVF